MQSSSFENESDTNKKSKETGHIQRSTSKNVKKAKLTDLTSTFIKSERKISSVLYVPNVDIVTASEVREKQVQVFTIVSTYDTKTKRIAIENGIVEHSTGMLNINTGRIETKYGTVDPKVGTVEVWNPQTGNTDIHPVTVDSKTGNIHVTSGTYDPKTGVIDNSLGQVMCIAPQDKTVVDVTSIVGTLDAQTDKFDATNGVFERSSGLLDMENDMVETKYGNIDLKSSELMIFDQKSCKLTHKPAKHNSATGQFMISGAIDIKTGKTDPMLSQLISIGAQFEPVVEITAIKGSTVVTLTGQINTRTGKIDTKYGQIDLVNHTITLNDPKTGATKTQDLKIDPITGQIIIKNVFNPKTGKFDGKQIMSVKIVNKRLHPVTGEIASLAEDKEMIIDSKTQQIWIADGKDPKTNEVRYTSSQVDPKTGTITIVYGSFNPKTKKIEKQTKIDPNVCIVNDDGVIFTSNGETDNVTNEPIFIASMIEPGNKKVSTKVSKLDKNTGKMVIVPLFLSKIEQFPVSLNNRLIESDEPFKNNQDSQLVMQPTARNAANSIDFNTIFTEKVSMQPPAVVTIQESTSNVTDVVEGMDTGISLQLESSSKNVLLQIVSLSGKIDTRTSKVNIEMAQLERSLGMFDVASGTISTKYGQINLYAKEIKRITDSKSHPVKIDYSTGQISFTGITYPEMGCLDDSCGYVINLGPEIDPNIAVITISGTYDAKKFIIDDKTAVTDVSSGQIDPHTSNICTIYGVLDLFSNSITCKHPKTGILETKEIARDPITGHIILTNQFNPTLQDHDKNYAHILSFHIVSQKTGAAKFSNPAITAQDIIIGPQTNRIWVPISKDEVTYKSFYTSNQVDSTGYIVSLYGVLNLKTNQITKQSNVESSNIKFDPISGQIFMAMYQFDEITGEPLFATTQIDEETGEIYTKVSKLDSKTSNLMLTKIILITKKDECGVSREIDASNVDYEPNTGIIRNVLNKIFYVYNMVDPITGELFQVESKDPRLAAAGTTITQTMILSGDIDPITGFVKTEYGHIDSETGNIKPSTAVRDPVTGKLILNYVGIDPAHFGRDVATAKEIIHCINNSVSAHEQQDRSNTAASSILSSAIDDASSRSDEHHVFCCKNGSESIADGQFNLTEIVYCQSCSTETITYEMERDGVVVSRLEQSVAAQTSSKFVDYDKAFEEAIQEALGMNLDLVVDTSKMIKQS